MGGGAELNNRPWTAAERQTVRNNWGLGTIAELSERMNRSVQAIRHQAWHMGLPNWRLIVRDKRQSVRCAGTFPNKYDYKARPESEKELWRELVSLLVLGLKHSPGQGRTAQMIDVAIDGLRRRTISTDSIGLEGKRYESEVVIQRRTGARAVVVG